MGRPKLTDYWDKVTKLKNGKLECKKCKREFSGGVSRIKDHVNRTRKGIGPCPIDPDDEGVHNNVASGSSNLQEAMNAANSLQVEDASQPIDTSIGGSINHQHNVESNYLVEVAPELIGTNIGGSINHQSNVEFTYFVEGIGPCPIDSDDEGVHNNVASGSSNPQEANSLQVAPELIGTNIGGSINHQRNVEFNYFAEDAPGMISTNIGGPVNHQDNVEYGVREDVHGTTSTYIWGPVNPQDNVAYGDAHGMISDYIGGPVDHPDNVEYGVAEDADGITSANIGGPVNYHENVENRGLTHNVIGNNNVAEASEEAIHNLNQIFSDLQRDEDDIKGQLQWLESRGKKRKRRVDNWLHELEGFKRRAGDMIQSRFLSGIEKFTQEVEKHNQEKPLVLSNEFVGIFFEENFKKVWELLKDDQVFIIGICGMGGAGKTFLAKYVKDEIKRKGTWDVFWVKVSQNFSISKLQHDIAKEMGVKLDDEDDEEKRAEDLSSALETKEKSILVLDDVWKYIDLQKVGIPLRVNGSIKVILITRLIHVCQQMDCSPKNMIRIWPLDSDKTWELFLVKLGHQGTPVKLSSKVEEIAESVVETCGGLPLAINVMARTMKGKLDDVDWWKHTLNKLNKGEMGEEMEEEVLKVLKLSYDNLVDEDLQKCFLYCALLPWTAKDDDRIMKLVEKGLINGIRSLEEIFAEGRTILGKLKDHSLLDLDFSDDLSPQRVLLRYLACYIMKGRHQYAMFKYEKGLPRLQEWTTDLEMVSLVASEEEIPGDMSPYCPKLSTLILCDGSMSSIPECFFEHMNALTVLDLSQNESLTALPNSLSILKSLVSLVLRGCRSLVYVPALGDLQALSRLDISRCSLKEVPQGLETLISLKWLDLSYNPNLTWVSGSVISGMTNMQYLDLLNTCIEITAQDIQGMKMLEYFGGYFFKWDNYDQFVRQFLINGFGLKHFFITFGNDHNHNFEDSWWPRPPLESKIVGISDCEKFGYFPLPIAFDELRILENNQWTCLCNGLSSESTSSSSWKIEIKSCEKLKSLFCSAESCCKSSSHLYSTLESINVKHCHSMKEIFANAPQPFPGAFASLKHIYIYDCSALEYLLTAEIVTQLQNLETIAVTICKSLKEVFAVSNNDEDDGPIIKLPKLTKLWLSWLPELKMVCKGIIVYGSSLPSDILEIKRCPKLERIPIIQRGTDRF